MGMVRLATWNVNGLRSAVRDGFEDWLTRSGANIVCLQEVKMHSDLITEEWFMPFRGYWNSARRRGYSGVVTLVDERVEVLDVVRGLGDPALDDEGRVLTTEFSDFVLVNVYAPHSHRKLIRLSEKLRFLRLLSLHIKLLSNRGKPIIFAGDLNVARDERDLSNPAANKGNAGFLPEEREWIDEVLTGGFIDAFRVHTEDSGHFTWWSMREGVRDRNIGWRLDYIVAAESLKDRIAGCFHSPEQRGSDHCPVTADIDF